MSAYTEPADDVMTTLRLQRQEVGYKWIRAQVASGTQLKDLNPLIIDQASEFDIGARRALNELMAEANALTETSPKRMRP